MPKKEKIHDMFNNIAEDYDMLNHLMSMGVDKSWRRKAIRKVLETGPEAPEPEGLAILDLACGTGDFAIAMGKKTGAGHITGVDLSENMLKVMKEKVGREGLDEKISMRTGDGENLPFGDGTFDRVTIAFGIRNFEDKEKGLREMLRVLKKGGRATILELSLPENALVRRVFNLYFQHILPRIGGRISGDKAAYRYLPASVTNFPKKAVFMEMMRKNGFRSVAHKAFTFGICRMYTGEKD